MIFQIRFSQGQFLMFVILLNEILYIFLSYILKLLKKKLCLVPDLELLLS